MEHPIIDWELAVKLAGNSLDTAKELLDILIKTLPAELADIQRAYHAKENKLLGDYVHRLHGALCYCGTPRLKQAAQALELALKENNSDNINKYFNTFEQEAHQLMSYHKPIHTP